MAKHSSAQFKFDINTASYLKLWADLQQIAFNRLASANPFFALLPTDCFGNVIVAEVMEFKKRAWL